MVHWSLADQVLILSNTTCLLSSLELYLFRKVFVYLLLNLIRLQSLAHLPHQLSPGVALYFNPLGYDRGQLFDL